MKPKLASFAGLMLIAASAAALGAPADAPQSPLPAAPAQSDGAQRDLGGDSERRLSELSRQTQAGRAELERLGKESDAAHARTVTRGRVYVRLARAGLLPVGGGFEALVDHAVRLERLRSAIGRDEALERDLSARRVALG
ncbi:MAG TPA: peptidase, partial [Polyangiaceae bacterium]